MSSEASPSLPMVERAKLRLDLVVLGLLALGAALQIAISLPVHRYAAEADAVITGMQAIDILHGARPIFFVGLRIGALGSYLTAGIFALLGPSRLALALYPITLGILTVVCQWLFWREGLPRRAAVLALAFVVLPSPSFLFWTYMPNGYPPVPLLCAAILWLAARLVRTGPTDRWGALGFGLAAGLAWWQSPQTLFCLGPAALWLAVKRREVLRDWKFLSLVLASALLGAAPWIGYNIVHPLASFQVYGVRPARSMAAIVDNIRYFVTYSLPEFAAPTVESLVFSLTDAPSRLLPWLRPIVLLAYASAAGLFVFRFRRLDEPGDERRLASPWLLIVGVLLATVVFNIFSEAGQMRGYTVRYLMPANLVIPGVLAAGCAFAARRSRALAILLAASVLLFNVASYHWPGRSTRQTWTREMENDQQLLADLDARGVEVVVGEYWATYPINFWSAGRVLAIPCAYDFVDRQALLPANVRRWAILMSKESQIDAWAERAAVSGQRETLAPRYSFLAIREGSLPTDSRIALQELLATCSH
ncbi:MAG: glycosyltransferase family 39 protein [Acidobacteriota bacterium]